MDVFVSLISEMKTTTWRASCRNRLGVNSSRAAGGIISLHGAGAGREEYSEQAWGYSCRHDFSASPIASRSVRDFLSHL